MRTGWFWWLYVLVGFSSGCAPDSETASRFVVLSPAKTGVRFTNQITENDSVNLVVNEYTYMGGGVGVGDFNRDGLPDLFFTGNQVSSQLYLNRGALRFEEVTKRAGLQTHNWCTGVSVTDINQDGWPDLYICTTGAGQTHHNLLFINNGRIEPGGVPTFTESARTYGLADSGFSTQAAFLDYDKDGDLDMYLLRHKTGAENPNDIRPNTSDPTDPSADRLFRNEGTAPGGSAPGTPAHPVFRDVSVRAGIQGGGYGLGIVVTDLNQDGWPDLYIGNDYLGNDFLWLNNQDGTFSNTAPTSLRHQSYSTMGTDAADLNNDGRPDLVTLDMMPATNERKKMMFSFLSFERHELERRAGYAPEFMRNMLQLNVGEENQTRKQVPLFAEVGQMAGVAETDWSWSVLLADFDNDGAKDVYITSGMGRDLINADFVQYRADIPDDPQTGAVGRQRAVRQRLAELGEVPLPNHFYRNRGTTGGTTPRFDDESARIRGAEPALSNGAAYADLDNDGDLDLIVSTLNKPASILENTAPPTDAHAITLRLEGQRPNRQGIGATVRAYAGGQLQTLEQHPVRGFLSTVDDRLHIGLGRAAQLDSLVITWPDNRQQTLRHLRADSVYTLRQASATARPAPRVPQQAPWLTDVTDQLGVGYRHQETFFNDYSFQRLLPRRYSQPGPYLATADLNADGRTDFYVGGAFRQTGQLGIQQADGRFALQPLLAGLKLEEDTDCLFLDADGDTDLDLLVTSGSVEFAPDSPHYKPRLYRNTGSVRSPRFVLDTTAFPASVRVSTGCVAAADFDADGKTDLFLGGRIVPTRYPEAPRSYLLRNTGPVGQSARFEDVTARLAPELVTPGMVTSAVWTDTNQDHRPDLVLAGEWMPVRVLVQTPQGIFQDTGAGESGLAASAGFWRRLTAADLDGDGDTDILAGNMGLNHSFHVSARQPAWLYAADYDDNGTIDPILCHYIRQHDGSYTLSPALTRNQWAAHMPAIRQRFPDNSSYARASLETILPETMRTRARALRCEETRTGYFENRGNGQFTFHPLPDEAQWAPVNALLVADLTADRIPDLLLAGNDYQTEVGQGQQDASYGLLLAGRGRGRYEAVSAWRSGLRLPGEVTDLKLVQMRGQQAVLVATNNDRLRVLRVRP